MEETSIKKFIIKGIAFLLIGCILFYLISVILMPEWVIDNDITLAIRGFYNEPKNSIDVIFVGNSNIYRGVSPMVLWKEQGISSYAFSSPMQKIWLSYYAIQEIFQYQKPKVIFLDVDEAFSDEKAKEANIRKLLDNMKWSKNKWEAINDPIFENSSFDKLSYVFPILRYHSRWNKLKEEDFRRIRLTYNSTTKGYIPTREVKPYDKVVKYMQRKNKQEKPQKQVNTNMIGEKSKQYLEKIIQICKENDTELILIELPSVNTWSFEKSEQMTEYAKEKGLTFLDLNKDENVKIDWKTDTLDAGFHLNRSGAEKVSKFFSDYLANTDTLPDHRNEDAYAKWNKDLETYEKQP